MHKLFAALIGITISCVAYVEAAPPPPPPPPADDVPPELDGYPTVLIRDQYYAWITRRLGLAREQMLRSVDAPDDLASATRGRFGPLVRIVNYEAGGEHNGMDLRFDQWCDLERCVWVASRAEVNDRAASVFLSANFDAHRAVENLRERGVAPTEVQSLGAQSFGLPDPLNNAEAHVTFVQATSEQCPQINDSLAIADQRAEEMSITRDFPRQSEFNPPPNPHSYLFEIVLPGWFVRSPGSPTAIAVEVRLSGFANHAEAQLVREVIAPLRTCRELNPE
jgi:hypothetical protein